MWSYLSDGTKVLELAAAGGALVLTGGVVGR
jgi:hypothetical protein